MTATGSSTAIVISADSRGIKFWAAVVLMGVGTGISAAALYLLLQWVQHAAWPGEGTILQSAANASFLRHVLILLGAGVLTGLGQLLLSGLSSGNGIDINAAIWFSAGRLPAIRTLGSAVLVWSLIMGPVTGLVSVGYVRAIAWAAGVSFEDRQDLLGHRSGRITTHYSQAELTSLIEAAERVCLPESRKTPATTWLRRKTG